MLDLETGIHWEVYGVNWLSPHERRKAGSVLLALIWFLGRIIFPAGAKPSACERCMHTKSTWQHYPPRLSHWTLVYWRILVGWLLQGSRHDPFVYGRHYGQIKLMCYVLYAKITTDPKAEFLLTQCRKQNPQSQSFEALFRIYRWLILCSLNQAFIREKKCILFSSWLQPLPYGYNQESYY